VYFRTIGVKRLVTSSANFIAVGAEAPKEKTVAQTTACCPAVEPQLN